MGDLNVEKTILELQLESLADYTGKQRNQLKNNVQAKKIQKITIKKQELDLIDTRGKLFDSQEENKMLKYKNIQLEKDFKEAKRKKSELRERLIAIQRSHKSNAQKAQERNLCQTLIR